MTNTDRRNFLRTLIFLVLFLSFTALVSLCDVRPIGPAGSSVGLATVNGALRDLIDTHPRMETVSDYLGLCVLVMAGAFALFGLIQLCRRRSPRRVDHDLYLLGGLYILTIACYALFEVFVINYRPVLVEGVREASYPSSHTLLAVVVTGGAVHQFKARIQSKGLCKFACFLCSVLCLAVLVCRIGSGIHWITDIVGAVLLGFFLCSLYETLVYALSWERKIEIHNKKHLI